MRIAFLCKRRYMGKDVIDDRYARLYEIPYQLAECGHDVLGLCLSYYRDSEGEWQHPTHTGNLAVVNVPANWHAPRTLDDVISISRLIPFCTPEDLEPHVHGVNIQRTTGTAYISDEGEHCFYESVTILQP